jgi:hypothetical protein
MAYRISQTDPATMSTEELNEELSGFVALAAEVAERMSLILCELRNRRQRHPAFRHTVLAFFREIADQSLSAEAAILLGNREMIKAVRPLPRDKQIEIANGAPIPVAVQAEDGTIKSEDVTITRMSSDVLRRAFGPSGLRSVHEQAEMIRAEGRVERHGMITVLRDEVALKIGNQTIRPEDLEGPLAALGYRLLLSRERKIA